MKFLLEKVETMDYGIVGVFDSIEEIHTWMVDKWGITFEEFKEEYPECDIDDWYDENEVRVRNIPEIK
jgi:hypothetical protein